MRGFSLIELLIVLGITGALLTMSLSVYSTTRSLQASRQAATAYASATQEARLLAKTMRNNTAWGVHIGASSVTVFSGNSYTARTTSRDRLYTLLPGVTVQGVSEVTFASFTGLPQTSGVTTFANAYATSSVTLFSSGVIEKSL